MIQPLLKHYSIYMQQFRWFVVTALGTASLISAVLQPEEQMKCTK